MRKVKWYVTRGEQSLFCFCLFLTLYKLNDNNNNYNNTKNTKKKSITNFAKKREKKSIE